MQVFIAEDSDLMPTFLGWMSLKAGADDFLRTPVDAEGHP